MKHAAGVMGLCAAMAVPALAEPILQITSQSYVLHRELQVVSFELVFNREPDFLRADPFGRQADAFWMDMDTDLNRATGLDAYWYSPPLGVDRRISGAQIWSDGGLIVHHEAYGPILGMLSYSLVGTTVRFDASYAMLAIPSGASGLYYALNVGEYGGTTQVIMVVPIPRAAGLGLAGLIGLGVWRARRGS